MTSEANVNVNVSEKETQVPLTTPTETTDTQPTQPTHSPTEGKDDSKIDLLKVEVTDDNTALNVIVGFLGIAQRRGVFAINESAKIFQCIEQFQKTEK